MKRRLFIKKSIVLGAFPFITSNLIARNRSDKIIVDKPFNLNYAPHFGMFKNNAGENLIDQIQYMYDRGFRALEDNGMKNRSISTQNKISSKMASLNMVMGVFVAHKIYWREPNLTSGNKELQRASMPGHLKYGHSKGHEYIKKVLQKAKEKISAPAGAEGPTKKIGKKHGFT